VDFERPDQPEQVDEFERELRQAMERRPAPPSLKRRIMQKRGMQRTERVQSHTMWWQRLAASLLLAGVIFGGYSWRQAEDRRKGEEAKQQVLTALRITNRALNDMNRRLAARNHEEK
jgi:hypothetical protein